MGGPGAAARSPSKVPASARRSGVIGVARRHCGGAKRRAIQSAGPSRRWICFASRAMTDGWASQGVTALSFVEASRPLVRRSSRRPASRLRKIVEAAEARSDPAVVSRPARHPARQDAGGRARRWPRWRAAAPSPRRCSPRTPRTARCFRCSPPAAASACSEMEGAADVLMVADPATFRVLPWAPATGWLLCDLHFADGRPVPFATRHLYRKRARSDSAKRGYDFVAGLEVEFHIFKLEDAQMAPEHAGQPGTPPDVSLLSHGYQYLTEQRYDQMEPVLEIIRRDVLALGLPLALGRGRVRPEPVRVHLCADRRARARRQHGAVSQRREADRAPPRLSRHLHVPAETAERVRVRLAPASVARVARRRRERLHGQGRRRGAEPVRPRLSRGPAGHARASDRVHDADHQRLQALPLLFAGAGPRDLGPRQPRRHDPRARRRQTMPRRGWKTASASPPPIPISTWPRRSSRASTASTASSIPARRPTRPTRPRRRCCRRRCARRCSRCRTIRSSARRSGAEFVDYYVHIKNAEIERFQAEVSDWEQREYFEMF